MKSVATAAAISVTDYLCYAIWWHSASARGKNAHRAGTKQLDQGADHLRLGVSKEGITPHPAARRTRQVDEANPVGYPGVGLKGFPASRLSTRPPWHQEPVSEVGRLWPKTDLAAAGVVAHVWLLVLVRPALPSRLAEWVLAVLEGRILSRQPW